MGINMNYVWSDQQVEFFIEAIVLITHTNCLFSSKGTMDSKEKVSIKEHVNEEFERLYQLMKK